jgi:hypothetical protein
MDVEIKEFSLTILVGVAFVASLILSVRLTLKPDFKISLPHLFKIGSSVEESGNEAEKILTFAHNIALVVVFLGLGLLLQDYSKSVVAQRSWPIPYSWSVVDWFVQWALPPAEMTSRLEPFFIERATDKGGRTWSPQREIGSICDSYFRSRTEKSNRDIPSDMMMSAFAKQLIPKLDIDSTRRVILDLQPAGDVLRNLLKHTDPQVGVTPGLKCEALLKVEDFYYRAKNRAYQNKEYFEELREIEGKLNFLRGMIFVIAIAWLIYIVLMMARGCRSIARRLCLEEPTAQIATMPKPRRFAQHSAWLLLLIVGGYFCKDAYRAEQLNFNNRVYGYFEVLCLLGVDCLTNAKGE